MSVSHPDKQNLIAFGQGLLNFDESLVVEQHLQTCSTCCETLLDLKDDPFVGLVRASSARICDSECDQATNSTNNTASQRSAGSESFAPAVAKFHSEAIKRDCAELPECPPDLQYHPRYRIIAPVGRGGMGSVYRAEHRLMQRSAAIKVINPELVRHPQAVERFRREVQAAAKLSHPNIVAAWDAEQAGDLHLLVMEFVDGTDLATIIQQHGPLGVEQACSYIAQAASGLQHAHEKGMVHRDIKPHNLMRTPDGRVRILDFGLAGIASGDDDRPFPDSAKGPSSAGTAGHLTNIGSVMGTPDYMAPEQAVDAHSADIRADIYSLGCTLYFLLTGKPPFEAEEVSAKLKAHAQNVPESLTKVRKDVPPELSRVAARMLAKNPAERFQTPSEVVAALKPWTGEEQGKTRIRTGIVAAIAGFLALLAGIIVVITDRGRLEIQSEVEDVKVAVRKGGEQMEVFDLKTGSQMKWVPCGEYELEVVGNSNDVTLDRTGFTMSRLGKIIVTAKWNTAGSAADSQQTPPEKTARVSPLAALKDSAAVQMYLNDPRNNADSAVPVVLIGREGVVSIRLGNWLVVFEDILCEPTAGILGTFNIPRRDERNEKNEGTVVFAAGKKLPAVFVRYRLGDDQHEVSINNHRFKLSGKATRLEFDDKSYDAMSSLQTILVGRDGSTKLETPGNTSDKSETVKGVSQNLITDPSFENTLLTQLPRDWRAWLNDGQEFRCEVVAGGHTGQRCLQISGKGTRGVVFGNELKADQTKRYSLKGWVKFEGDKDARALIKFNYFRGNEFLGVHDLVGATADQPGWRLFEKTDLLEVYPTADHFYVMCHVEGSGTGWFDDLELIAWDRDKLPSDFDVRHGRHNRLHGPNSVNRWVGTWDVEYAIREFDNSPTESKVAMTMVSERTLGDYFLLSHAKSLPAEGQEPPATSRHERLQFLLFDQNLGAFRQWVFNNQGKVFEWRGPWNNDRQSLELRALPDASNLQSTEHFVDDDRIEAKLWLQYVMGQRDAGRWTATRKAFDGKVDVPIVKTHVTEPAELSQLNKFAGEWTIHAKYKPSVWNPLPREETIRETSEWILGGRFLMTRAFNEKDELTSIWIATWEPEEKSNRFWFFNADGSSGEWRLTWDEAASGFQFRAVDMPAGWSGTGFNHWVNEDTFDNQGLIKDDNGRVLLDSTQERRRKK